MKFKNRKEMSGVLNTFKKFENLELGCSLTIIKVENTIWFFGTEFAIALAYVNPQKAIRMHVDESDKFYFQDLNVENSVLRKVTESVTFKIHPHTIVISESGAYDLIFSSKLPAAKKFKRWVIKEVLPSIRETGSYAIPTPVPSLPEGPIQKLETITNNEVIGLVGEQKKEFRYKSVNKSNIAKDLTKAECGKRGGEKMQQRRRDMIEKKEELERENKLLKGKLKYLEEVRIEKLLEKQRKMEEEIRILKWKNNYIQDELDLVITMFKLDF